MFSFENAISPPPMNTNKHNKTIGRRVSPNTSRPLSKGCPLIRLSVPIAGSNNQRDAMGRTAYAGIRKCGHDGCGFAPRSTVRNFHFDCDLSQLDLVSQITGQAARRTASDMRSLHESMAGVVAIDPNNSRRVERKRRASPLGIRNRFRTIYRTRPPVCGMFTVRPTAEGSRCST